MRRRDLLASVAGILAGGLAGCRPPRVETELTVLGFKPIPFPVFGGLNTLQDPNDVIFGMSPDLRDVVFVPGAVKMRPGLTNLGVLTTVLASAVSGLFNHIAQNGTSLLLINTDGGALYLANIETAAIFSLSTTVALDRGKMRAAEFFGRTFFVIGDGKHGLFIPRHLAANAANDSRVERVGTEGSYVNTMAAADNAAAGSIVAGQHDVAVIFETRSGYRSISPNAATWNAAGAKKVDITNIPLGPPNVIKRILAFTASYPAGTTPGSFYFIVQSAMVIPDNTTTSVTALDFTDTALLNGENVDHLFRRVLVPEAAGVTTYGQRTVWWGFRKALNYAHEQNVRKALVNLSFDGGFYNTNTPVGWGETTPGQSPEPTSVIAGFALKVTGDGSATRGHIFQSVFSTLFPSTELFTPGKSYRVRAWIDALPGVLAGTVRIYFSGSSAPGLSVAFGAGSTLYNVYEAEIWSATDAVSTTAALHLQVDGNLTSGQVILIDEVEIFPAEEQFDESSALVSDPEDPEAIDGITGRIQVSPGDGQAMRNWFAIRGFLYAAKERSLYVTADNGDDPSTWEVRQVSDRVGTPSTHGVGLGDEWAVIAARSGLWFFDGGELTEDKKLSREIQPTWDSINWQYGHLIEVLVDTEKKRILVNAVVGAGGVGPGGIVIPNRVLMMDYTEGFGDPLLNGGRGRKWSPWFIEAGSLGVLERTSGVRDILLGSPAKTAGDPRERKTFKLDDAALSDDGIAINSYYQTAYLASGDGTRLEFGYLTANVTGAGTLALRLYRGNQGDLKDLRGWTLDDNGFKSMERKIDEVRERLAVRFGTNAVGEHFDLNHLVLWAKGAPWAPVRGHNK